MLNVIGELKKCCNHPFLFESAEEGYRGSDTDKSAVDRYLEHSWHAGIVSLKFPW